MVQKTQRERKKPRAGVLRVNRAWNKIRFLQFIRMESIRIDGGSDSGGEAPYNAMASMASEFKTTIFVHTVDFPNDDADDDDDGGGGIVERL